MYLGNTQNQSFACVLLHQTLEFRDCDSDCIFHRVKKKHIWSLDVETSVQGQKKAWREGGRVEKSAEGNPGKSDLFQKECERFQPMIPAYNGWPTNGF